MMRRVALIALVSLAFCAQSAEAGFVVNGGAETGDTSGWVTTGVEVAPATNAGTLGLPLGVGLGNHVFTGGLGPTTQSLTQTIDVSGMAAQIDAGGIQSVFSALLQSRRDTGGAQDTVTGSLTFFAGNGNTLASATFVDTSILVNVFDWSVASDQRIVPVGTRRITINFDMTRNVGTSTDAFVDNVELDLQPTSAVVPAPSSAVLLITGGVIALLISRRRKPAVVV